MSIASYTITRNVEATRDGQPCRIAIATVIHENGHSETVAVNEDLIRFAGEGIIDAEVRRAMNR